MTMAIEPDYKALNGSIWSDEKIIDCIAYGDEILKYYALRLGAKCSTEPSPAIMNLMSDSDARPRGTSKKEKKDRLITKNVSGSIIKSVTNYSFDVSIHIKPVKKPYSEIWEPYGILVPASYLYKTTGFHRPNYTNARNGKRKVSAGEMIGACLVSKVHIQDAFDAFHECCEVQELPAYGLEASALAYFLVEKYEPDPNDKDLADKDPNLLLYEKLIECTLRANRLAGIEPLPKRYLRTKKWLDMYSKLRECNLL